MLLSSGLVGDQRGTIWEMLAKVDSQRSEAGGEEEDLKDVLKVRQGLRLWAHQQHQQCYLVRTIQMRQAQSSRTKVSQLWYMMLQTCTRWKQSHVFAEMLPEILASLVITIMAMRAQT